MQSLIQSVWIMVVCFGVALQADAAPPATLPSQNAGLQPPFEWVSTGPVLQVQPDPGRRLVSIKDPSAVYFNNRWHVYATYATHAGAWGMLYTSFADWKDAAAAPQYYMERNPNLRGYHCAPQCSISRRRNCGIWCINRSI